ncbi:serine/arginine repetitive matrix protein 1-like [Spea bombifrons]|uniref:serine/arginine repetitive matrix protein 1-like n=1 Tax=Spea bombifrons TaxID=233779 RepID=UPI00234A35D2|nr:serine/arginine repetitive matrix protein 1-like [Spea bombifrons]
MSSEQLEMALAAFLQQHDRASLMEMVEKAAPAPVPPVPDQADAAAGNSRRSRRSRPPSRLSPSPLRGGGRRSLPVSRDTRSARSGRPLQRPTRREQQREACPPSPAAEVDPGVVCAAGPSCERSRSPRSPGKRQREAASVGSGRHQRRDQVSSGQQTTPREGGRRASRAASRPHPAPVAARGRSAASRRREDSPSSITSGSRSTSSICDDLPPRLSPAASIDGSSPTLVWILGHSFIYWAARRAERRVYGRNLGFPYDKVRIRWRGIRGLRWVQIPESKRRWPWWGRSHSSGKPELAVVAGSLGQHLLCGISSGWRRLGETSSVEADGTQNESSCHSGKSRPAPFMWNIQWMEKAWGDEFSGG